MKNDLGRVYRKSELGLAEIKSRSNGLTVHARTALILVNGVNSVAALQKKMGPDAATLLQELAALGHIEPVPEKANPVVLSEPKVSVEEYAEVAARLSRLRREILTRLAPLYGPDVVLIAEPLLKARTLEAFSVALAGLEAKLRVYLGKKRAAEVLAGLRPY